MRKSIWLVLSLALTTLVVMMALDVMSDPGQAIPATSANEFQFLVPCDSDADGEVEPCAKTYCCRDYNDDGDLIERICRDGGLTCPTGFTSEEINNCNECPTYPSPEDLM